MRILDDGPAGAGAHEFAVESEIEGDARLRDLWEKATDKGEHGVSFARVRREGSKIDAEALAVYLLHDPCGVALVSWPEPPGGG